MKKLEILIFHTLERGKGYAKEALLLFHNYILQESDYLLKKGGLVFLKTP